MSGLRTTVAALATSGVLEHGRNRAIVAEAAGLATVGQPSTDGKPPVDPTGWLCLEFTVPAAPRGWQRDTPLGYGHSIKTATEAAYQRDIARFARQAKEACGIAGLSRGAVRLAVVAYIAVPKSYGKAKRADCLAGRILPILKPDFDNIAKSVADALTGVLWVDDKQVVHGSCLKVWAEEPSLYVRVQAL